MIPQSAVHVRQSNWQRSVHFPVWPSPEVFHAPLELAWDFPERNECIYLLECQNSIQTLISVFPVKLLSMLKMLSQELGTALQTLEATDRWPLNEHFTDLMFGDEYTDNNGLKFSIQWLLKHTAIFRMQKTKGKKLRYFTSASVSLLSSHTLAFSKLMICADCCLSCSLSRSLSAHLTCSWNHHS